MLQGADSSASWWHSHLGAPRLFYCWCSWKVVAKSGSICKVSLVQIGPQLLEDNKQQFDKPKIFFSASFCHFPVWSPMSHCFFLKMSNSHCAAHWRSCVSFVRWIWSLSQSSLSLWLQEQKIYCRVIWPEDNFILREGQRVMGRRKKKNKSQANKKGKILNAHSRCLGGMQVPALFTLNIVSDWHNEE